MDLSKLKYKKETSEQTPRDSVQKQPSKETSTQKNIEASIIPSMYKKIDGVLSQSLVFVLSGGEKKENNFLSELINIREFHSLRIVFMSKKRQGLQPYQMQDNWQKIQKDGEFMIDGQTYRINTIDKVFLLSDVDEFYDQLVELCRYVSDSQSQWIVSNPCFEIWLYYCYHDNPETDLACLQQLTVSKRSQKLKSLGQNVVDGGLNPCLAFEKMFFGIENSKANYEVDENGIPVLYATQMHEMAQYIIDTMNANANEYLEFVKRKEEWRKSMRSKSNC